MHVLAWVPTKAKSETEMSLLTCRNFIWKERGTGENETGEKADAKVDSCAGVQVRP